MKFLIFLLIFNQTEHEILLKRTPNLLYPLIPSIKKGITMGKGDTLSITDYWWFPDDIAYVTDPETTAYVILSFDWNIGDTVFLALLLS